MGERASYAPGTFCWADLPTTDQDAAKAFYGELFGWVAEDMPVGEGMVYSMMRLGEKNVAAISSQNEQQREAGMPAVWNSYVSVASAEDTAARAAEHGATIVAPPFDVTDAGRMAVIEDPQGAFFCLWEPGSQRGAEIVNAHGALVWNELNTPDLEASRSFYAAAFDWGSMQMEGTEDPYLVIKNGDASNGGLRPLNPPQLPPHWLVYFGHDDLDGAIAKVQELGGELHAGPIDIGIARIAVVADPQGGMFALYNGTLDP